MSGRGMNWNRAAERDRVRRQGVEAAGDTPGEADLVEQLMRTSAFAPLDGVPVRKPKRRPSKRELSAALAATIANAKIRRQIKCVCGHSAAVDLPAARSKKTRLKCSKCGRRIEI